MERKAKTRWARGFFRLWVVFSAIWFALLSTLMFQDYPTKSGRIYQIVADDGQTISADQVFAAAEKARAKGDEEAEARLRQIAQEKLTALRDRQRSTLQQWAIFGVVPPLALLLLGLLAAWVLKGFRPDRVSPPTP